MNNDESTRAAGADVDRLVQWLLDGVQLDATVFHVGQYCGRWQASTAGRALGSFHLILHGGCWLHVAGRAPERLAPGDAVFMLRDLPHVLGPDPAPPTAPDAAMQQLGSAADGATGLACGFFHFRGTLTALVVDSFPDCLVLRADEEPLRALQALFGLVLAEPPRPPDAPSPLIARLAELMFFYAIRHAARRTDVASGLLALARRPEFARLLERMLDAPGQDWSTANMARAANMSRTSFYKHFSETCGQAPAQFLLLLRMKIAARRLHDGESVERTAGHVGYASYAAFARAFKKVTGEQPGAFRRQRHGADAAANHHKADDRAENRDGWYRTSGAAGLQ